MRLIDADALLEILRHEEEYNADIHERADGIRDAIMNVLEAPTADVRENIRGEWIEVEVFPESYNIEGVKTWSSEMQCDQCGFRHTAIEGHMAQYNFCPNCGARMEVKTC